MPTSKLANQRVESGVKGLDAILQGGFFKGGIYIVMGHPGAGKTILANQIAFSHIKTGGHALYVTLLAETHGRMVASLSGLDFFKLDEVSKSITYVSGYRAMEKSGLDGLLNLLRNEVRARNATLLIVDGLVTAAAIAGSELAFKRFIHELQALADLIGCTAILLTSAVANGKVLPEHTMVDGIIELSDVSFGVRAIRHIEVKKFRGAPQLRGKHVFEITSQGVTVFPRLEASSDISKKQKQLPSTRKQFDSKQLDIMLGGGVPAGTSTLIMGSPGSGKTLTALQFAAAGIKHGESVAYYGFFEQPPQLQAVAAAAGLKLAGKGRFNANWSPPLELLIDQVGERIISMARKAKAARLIIDGINGFYESNVHEGRVPNFLGALLHTLRGDGVTVLLTYEIPSLFGPELSVPFGGLSAVTDNVILLRKTEIGSRYRNFISILKARETHHDDTIRMLDITSRGIQVHDEFTGAERVLTGLAHPLTPAPVPPKPKRR